MRSLPLLFLLALAASCASVTAATAPAASNATAQPSKPNVVMIVIDDLGENYIQLPKKLTACCSARIARLVELFGAATTTAPALFGGGMVLF